jgi:hypothetical protein
LSNFTLKSPEFSRLGTEFFIFLEESVFFKKHFIDPLKRIEIDRAGARFGQRIASNLIQFDSVEELCSVRDCNRPYLYDNPEVYGAKWKLVPGQSPCDYDQEVAFAKDPKSASSLMKKKYRPIFDKFVKPKVK